MKGLVQGGAGAGSLETTKPKSVMVGIRRRGRWDVVGFGRDKWELEVQVIKDMMVDCSEVLEFELGVLGTEPFKERDLVVVEEWSLKDIRDPLTLLCMCQWVVNMTRNGGLDVR